MRNDKGRAEGEPSVRVPLSGLRALALLTEAKMWADRIEKYLTYVRDDFVRKAPHIPLSIDFEIRRSGEIRDTIETALKENQ